MRISIENQQVEITAEPSKFTADAANHFENRVAEQMHENGHVCLHDIAVDIMKEARNADVDVSISIIS